jgi:hypothetical protein
VSICSIRPISRIAHCLDSVGNGMKLAHRVIGPEVSRYVAT